MTRRIDERDTMFARMDWEKEGKAYRDYYARHPEKMDIDEEIRQMPGLLQEGTATYDPLIGPFSSAGFQFLSDIGPLVEGPVAEEQVPVTPERITRLLKNLATHLGAVKVGALEMTEDLYYSHRGRHEADYGETVVPRHRYGFVFAVEMDETMMNRAPQIEEILEVTKGYVNAGIIGMWIAYYLRKLGYDARNHMDGNYLAPLPLVAARAGLGQMGRHSVLVTPDYGSRIRLGLVTTDLELVCDEPIDFGLETFCMACGLCAKTCPGKAISHGKPEDHHGDGHPHWRLDQAACYKAWTMIGTDCGICVSACPFSHHLDSEKVAGMKENPRLIGEILSAYREKEPIRPYIREPLDLIK